MQLKRSPFYLLNVSCRATRREILEAAEDAAFLGDPQLCEEAGNTLLNPGKRLSAELDWFLDLSRAQEETVRSAVGNGSAIDAAGLRGLSRLNALLHNFGKGRTLEDEISTIDACYETVNARDVAALINTAHAEAKLSEVQLSAVSQALGKKREDIRRTISDRLTALGDSDIIKVATGLARTYSNRRGEGCTVIHDIIDWYELHMQGKIEEAVNNIHQMLEDMHASSSGGLETKALNLVSMILVWGNLFLPVQLKLRTDGMSNQAALSLGKELRMMAVSLHNENGLTGEARRITLAMHMLFFDSGEFDEQLKKDIGLLNKLLKERDMQELLAEIKELGNEADRFMMYYCKSTVDDFIAHVISFNKKAKNSEIDEDTCLKLRTQVCTMSRDVVGKLYNSQGQLRDALRIIRALQEAFSDVPMLKNALVGDHDALTSEIARRQQLARETEEKKKKEEADRKKAEEQKKREQEARANESKVYLDTLENLRQEAEQLKIHHSDSEVNDFISHLKAFNGSLKNAEISAGICLNLRIQLYNTALNIAAELHNTQHQLSASLNITEALLEEFSDIPSIKKALNELYANLMNEWVKKARAVRQMKKNEEDAEAGEKGCLKFLIILFCVVILGIILSCVSNDSKSNPASTGNSVTVSQTTYSTAKPTERAVRQSILFPVGTKMYADIVSIQPYHGIRDDNGSYYTHFVCRCETTSGSYVWLYLTCYDYRVHFDPSASGKVGERFEKLSLSSTKRIHGKVFDAIRIKSNLPKKIGTDKVVYFYRVESD